MDVLQCIEGRFVTGWLVYENIADLYHVIIGRQNKRIDGVFGFSDYLDAGDELRRLVEAWDASLATVGDVGYKRL